MLTEFTILQTARNLIFNAVKELNLNQIHKIPKGFTNNIAWNVAHIVVTQQLLHYSLSELNCLAPDDLIDKFRKGTSSKTKLTQEEWNEVKDLLVGLPTCLEEDYHAKIFKTFTKYQTSTGFVIKNIETAIMFNNLHEGIHLGIILGLKKFI